MSTISSTIRAVASKRNRIWGLASYLRSPQKRWATVHDVRLVTTQHSDRSVLEKYREKLDRKAEEVGVGSVEELKQIYQDKIKALREQATIPLPKEAAAAAAATAAPLSTSSSSSSSFFPTPPAPPHVPPKAAEKAPAGIKTLSSYLDIPKVLALPPHEIESLWRHRHAADPHSLCATIPLPTYRTMERTARQHPHFILPLPRTGLGDAAAAAAEIHYLQWTFPAAHTVVVLFTHLAEYKLRGEFSQPHTTITHHLELARAKELVLLRGHVLEGRGVSVEEAKWLLMCLQKFYGVGGEAGERRRLLELFGRGDEGFRVEELVREAEKVV